MISELHIENFRSIEKATINLGRITVLTGANNSGKSSLMYALYALQNLKNNPNRSLNEIFNFLNVINLGSFKEVVFQKNENKIIKIGITLNDDYSVKHQFYISPYISKIELDVAKPFKEKITVDVAYPYPVNTIVDFSFENETAVMKGNFSGISINTYSLSLRSNFIEEIVSPELQNSVTNFANAVNNWSNGIEVVSTKRGFFKPVFGTVPLQNIIVTEDELATKIALDRDLQGHIAHYLEKIANRSFSVYVVPGSAIFYLQTRDKKTGFTTDLVNEGTGTNQLVTILAKALQPDKKFICIDEPEIHLHPSMIAKLVEVLVEIAYQDDKQFLLSTHSEHFVTCLLAEVVKKTLQPDDLKIYYLTKDKKGTQIEHQAVNADGQIEGGLKNFYEAELSNLESFFKLT